MKLTAGQGTENAKMHGSTLSLTNTKSNGPYFINESTSALKEYVCYLHSITIRQCASAIEKTHAGMVYTTLALRHSPCEKLFVQELHAQSQRTQRAWE